jgi:arylsulfatase A-like enzyme
MTQRLIFVFITMLLVMRTELPGALDRPKLQIINGTTQVMDVFWINDKGERVPNGSVQPGSNTIISTTLGHRFALVGREDLKESLVTAEVRVQAFRVGGVASFYTQRADAGGFPVVASARVNPYALKEAVYIIDMMLSKRPDVRAAMVKSGARLCILAHDEFTCDQPEWAWLATEPEKGFEDIGARDFRDARARGMGGSNTDPYCSCAEENLLAYEGDPYSTECILIHELAHNIHLRGMSNVDATFDPRVKACYDAAMKVGLWKGKYASVNHHEYFAEGVQSWFNNNRENDHDHNHVNTRAELLDYDPGLAALCREVFGDTVLKYTKPQTRLTGHLAGYDPKQAPRFAWPARLKKARELIRAKAKARAASTQPSKPNILLILADDLGYGDVRCYNAASKVPTPNIDRLAGEGMRFTDAHSPATVCTPSRYSLMTGQMAFRVPNGGTVFTGAGGPSLIARGRLTLPAMLKQQGYATAAVGKWHIGLTFRDADGRPIHRDGLEAIRRIDFSRRIEGGPLDHGFDRFFGTACCPTTDWLYAFIDSDRIRTPPTSLLDRGKLPRHPYANDCRGGLIAPDFDLQEVDMKFLQKSREFIAQHAHTSPQQPFFLYHATQAVHLPSLAGRDFRGQTQAGPHGDFIAELDHIVGELMKDLDLHGLTDNTLVILSSDNGPETTAVVHMRAHHAHDGAKPWRGVKRDTWEGGHRVPFIVRWPARIQPGTTSDQLACLTDVMATAAAITGTDLPRDSAEDSFNLLPILEGQATLPIRPYLLTQAFRGTRTLAIRRGPWKYITHQGSGGNNYDRGELKPYALPETDPEAPGQLYDLTTDPGETRNLYSQKPGLVKELQDLLKQTQSTGRSRP